MPAKERRASPRFESELQSYFFGPIRDGYYISDHLLKKQKMGARDKAILVGAAKYEQASDRVLPSGSMPLGGGNNYRENRPNEMFST